LRLRWPIEPSPRLLLKASSPLADEFSRPNRTSTSSSAGELCLWA